MRITGYERRISFEIEKYGHPATSKALAEELTNFSQDNFLLTVLGKAKTGKSTLINASLGRQVDRVAPIDELPASTVISQFMNHLPPRV